MPQLTQAVFVNLGDSPPAPGTDVVVLVDDSGSMAPFVDDVRTALREFVGDLPAGTRVGLASFGTRLNVLCRPTDCAEFLCDQAGRFIAESGGTALYDAVGDALAMFDESGRRRALVLLTDCDEGGSQRYGADALLPRLVGAPVRLIVVRFGEKSDPALDGLALSSGGASLRCATWKDVGRILGETAELLRPFGPTLRGEFLRLAGGDTGAAPSWLSLLSLDAWGRPEVEGVDGSHVRFPREVDVLATLQAELEACLGRLLEEELRNSSRQASGLTDPDVTLLVAGWAGDAAFHHLSPFVSAVYGRVVENLNITRTVHTVYVPLVGEMAALDPETQALCWAWLAAVHNCGGSALPKAVLSCGSGNRNSALNPRGFHAEPANVVVLQAANLLWTLADDPATVRQVSGRSLLKAAGSASLVAPTARRIRRRAAEASVSQVRRFADATRPPDQAWVAEARKDVDAWGLRADSLAGRLAGILFEGLGELRLDPTDFWPPPARANRDEYAESLLELLENRGAALQLRRLALLLRRIRESAGGFLETRRQDIAAKVDEVLFRPDSGGVGSALEHIDRLRSELEEEASRLSLGLVTAGKGPSGATPGPDDALDRVRQLLERRPLPEAIALRHLTLAPLAAAAAYLGLRHLPAIVLDLGPLEVAPTAAVLTGLAVVALGWHRWRRYRRLLARAVAEYLVALESRAFARAAQDCLDRARGIYGTLLSFIGNKSTTAEWEPPAVRTEADLSQQQCVAGFGEYLVAAVARRAAAEVGEENVENPFVVEFGGPVLDLAQDPPRARATPDGLAHVTEGRGELDAADPAWRERWRECLRRKRCDSLEEFLDFHSRRVGLPGQLFDTLIGSFSAPQRSSRSIATLWKLCDEPTRGAVAAEMERRSFPPMALDERLAAAPVVLDCVAAEPGVVAELRSASRGAFRTTEERGVHALVPADRLHRVRIAGNVGEVPLLVDWAACRRSWERLDDAARRSVLTLWVGCGDPSTWVDPSTGARVVTTHEAGRDAGPAEESLI